jgi:hypothetical protein
MSIRTRLLLKISSFHRDHIAAAAALFVQNYHKQRLATPHPSECGDDCPGQLDAAGQSNRLGKAGQIVTTYK